jgi:hypothetical protein
MDEESAMEAAVDTPSTMSLICEPLAAKRGVVGIGLTAHRHDGTPLAEVREEGTIRVRQDDFSRGFGSIHLTCATDRA